MHTVVRPAGRRPASAATLACSHSAITRGVASTATVPEPNDTEVSASVDDEMSFATQPGIELHECARSVHPQFIVCTLAGNPAHGAVWQA